MIKQCVAVYDSASSVYMDIMCVRHLGEARRWFSDVVNGLSGRTPISDHPDDFHLFHIGAYDDNLGVMLPLAEHVTLGCALEYIVKKS